MSLSLNLKQAHFFLNELACLNADKKSNQSESQTTIVSSLTNRVSTYYSYLRPFANDSLKEKISEFPLLTKQIKQIVLDSSDELEKSEITEEEIGYAIAGLGRSCTEDKDTNYVEFVILAVDNLQAALELIQKRKEHRLKQSAFTVTQTTTSSEVPSVSLYGNIVAYIPSRTSLTSIFSRSYEEADVVKQQAQKTLSLVSAVEKRLAQTCPLNEETRQELVRVLDSSSTVQIAFEQFLTNCTTVRKENLKLLKQTSLGFPILEDVHNITLEFAYAQLGASFSSKNLEKLIFDLYETAYIRGTQVNTDDFKFILFDENKTDFSVIETRYKKLYALKNKDQLESEIKRLEQCLLNPDIENREAIEQQLSALNLRKEYFPFEPRATSSLLQYATWSQLERNNDGDFVSGLRVIRFMNVAGRRVEIQQLLDLEDLNLQGLKSADYESLFDFLLFLDDNLSSNEGQTWIREGMLQKLPEGIEEKLSKLDFLSGDQQQALLKLSIRFVCEINRNMVSNLLSLSEPGVEKHREQLQTVSVPSSTSIFGNWSFNYTALTFSLPFLNPTRLIRNTLSFTNTIRQPIATPNVQLVLPANAEEIKEVLPANPEDVEQVLNKLERILKNISKMPSLKKEALECFLNLNQEHVLNFNEFLDLALESRKNSLERIKKGELPDSFTKEFSNKICQMQEIFQTVSEIHSFKRENDQINYIKVWVSFYLPLISISHCLNTQIHTDGMRLILNDPDLLNGSTTEVRRINQVKKTALKMRSKLKKIKEQIRKAQTIEELNALKTEQMFLKLRKGYTKRDGVNIYEKAGWQDIYRRSDQTIISATRIISFINLANKKEVVNVNLNLESLGHLDQNTHKQIFAFIRNMSSSPRFLEWTMDKKSGQLNPLPENVQNELSQLNDLSTNQINHLINLTADFVFSVEFQITRCLLLMVEPIDQ